MEHRPLQMEEAVQHEPLELLQPLTRPFHKTNHLQLVLAKINMANPKLEQLVDNMVFVAGVAALTAEMAMQ